MRAATAYFAGVGTVAVAIGAGLGGGLLLGDIMSPQQPKHPSSEVTRLEQRSSSQPIPAMTGASQPVPYMAGNQAAATVAEQPAQPQQAQPQPPQQSQSPQPQQAQPQVQQVSTQPTEPKPKVEHNVPAQATAATPPAGAEQRSAPEDAFAKARDSDLKRDGRRAEDKRKWERRQQWSERRKWRQRKDDDDLKDVEASVREDSERRSFFGNSEPRHERSERPMFAREPGFGRGFSLFDD